MSGIKAGLTTRTPLLLATQEKLTQLIYQLRRNQSPKLTFPNRGFYRTKVQLPSVPTAVSAFLVGRLSVYTVYSNASLHLASHVSGSEPFSLYAGKSMDISTDFTFYYIKESGALLEAKGGVASPPPRPEKSQLSGQAQKAHLLTEALESPTNPCTIL